MNNNNQPDTMQMEKELMEHMGIGAATFTNLISKFMESNTRYKNAKDFGYQGRVLVYFEGEDATPVAYLSANGDRFIPITNESEQTLDELLKPVGKLDIKPDVEVVVKPDVKPDVEVVVKPDVKPDVEVDVKPHVDVANEPIVEQKKHDESPTTGGVELPVVTTVSKTDNSAIVPVGKTNNTNLANSKFKTGFKFRRNQFDEKSIILPRRVTNIKANNVYNGNVVINNNITNNYYTVGTTVSSASDEQLKTLTNRMEILTQAAAKMGVSVPGVKKVVDNETLKNLPDRRTDYAGRNMQLASHYMVLPKGAIEYTPMQLAVVNEKTSDLYYLYNPIEYYEYFEKLKDVVVIPGKNFRVDYKKIK